MLNVQQLLKLARGSSLRGGAASALAAVEDEKRLVRGLRGTRAHTCLCFLYTCALVVFFLEVLSMRSPLALLYRVCFAETHGDSLAIMKQQVEDGESRYKALHAKLKEAERQIRELERSRQKLQQRQVFCTQRRVCI